MVNKVPAKKPAIPIDAMTIMEERLVVDDDDDDDVELPVIARVLRFDDMMFQYSNPCSSVL
jgi:hypothetical protein